MLPHELVSHLAKSGHFLDLGPDKSQAYWKHFQSVNASWSMGELDSMPLFLYGDDTKYNQNDKLTVLTLGAVLDERTHSLLTHWPLCVVREVLELTCVTSFVGIQ